MTGALDRIAVFGAGAFGTALALAGERAGRAMTLVGRDAQAMRRIAEDRVNGRFLPHAILAETITVTADAGRLVQADAVVLATPAQASAEVARALAGLIRPGIPILVCAKGIERMSGRFPSAILADALPENPIAVLSGPSFAADIAAGLPTALVIGIPDQRLAGALAQALNSRHFRLYHTPDRRGVEIGGAAKNVLAIAAGIAEARGLGESAKAALIARGFAEMRRFAAAAGAEAETLMGLSGLGDLVLTASSAKSRNFSLGLRLGAGEELAAALGGPLSEGALTAEVLVRLADALAVDMPISAAVAAVVAGKLGLAEAMEGLLSRPLRAE